MTLHLLKINLWRFNRFNGSLDLKKSTKNDPNWPYSHILTVKYRLNFIKLFTDLKSEVWMITGQVFKSKSLYLVIKKYNF